MARWKRGVSSQGVGQALDYAFGGTCDASHDHQPAPGADTAAAYGDELVMRYTATDSGIQADALGREKLRAWIDGVDPDTGIQRGRVIPTPDADLLLDATINAPKSYSVAALIDDDLSAEYEALQDRLRDRIISTWQRELNARRGAGGAQREELARIEVVELRHERSRSLDPHKHRHMWLNMKVQGRDGKWSNLDSRVALKFQTVVNAEGDLAARTDPRWVAALAAKGYTLNGDGEIEQLAHIVRPLSRRSNQIEANRAMKLAEWHTDHPGEEPSPDVMSAIDRWAWSYGRPNKPGTVDEGAWKQSVRDELAALDSTILEQLTPAHPVVRSIAELDRKFLAMLAITDADKRARSASGRFSVYDIRAGATRAVAGSGVVADRSAFDELIEDVAARAIRDYTVDLLADERAVPGHVKALMATETAELKAAVGRGFDALVNELEAPAEAVDQHTTMDLAATAPAGPILVNERQAAAAGMIAGTARLVTVTGPAGTGKTTMLQVAKIALQNQNRRLMVVAPTKKAASVAGREIGAAASSLHVVLLDHGWHTVTDKTGREVWRKYAIGEITETGAAFTGPRRYRLTAGDRIVVDEAGMVDLGAAEALIDVARTTGAGVALVGDQFQAAPVGHTGAMAMAVGRTLQSIELEEVHRFKNPVGGNEPDTDYARLSLLLRYAGTAADAERVAKALDERGSIIPVDSEDAVRDYLVDGYFTNADRGRTVALVTATNEDAQTVNERIQAARIQRGEIDASTTVFGQNDQAIHPGDVVQTRRNDRNTNVENRALWRVRGADVDGRVELENLHTPGDLRWVDQEYVREHVHLAYASTVQGVQGETTDAAIVAGDVDASGLYVGMTRGRRDNQVITVASSKARAVEKVAETILRGRGETELSDSVAAAGTELSRAARASIATDATVPAWDSDARTFGHVVDVDEQLATVAAALPAMRDELATIQDQLARDKKTLDHVNARLAEREAKNRQAAASAGAPVHDTSDLERNRERLVDRIAERAKLSAETAPAFDKRMRTVEALRVEKAVRDRLTPAEIAAEDQARADRLARVRAGSGVQPAPRPTLNRGPSAPGLPPAGAEPDTAPTVDDGLSF